MSTDVIVCADTINYYVISAGLDHLHYLTGSYNAKMRIDLQRPNKDKAFVEYVRFRVAGANKAYELEGIIHNQVYYI